MSGIGTGVETRFSAEKRVSQAEKRVPGPHQAKGKWWGWGSLRRRGSSDRRRSAADLKGRSAIGARRGAVASGTPPGRSEVA